MYRNVDLPNTMQCLPRKWVYLFQDQPINVGSPGLLDHLVARLLSRTFEGNLPLSLLAVTPLIGRLVAHVVVS